MNIFHLINEPNWTQRLATLLEQAEAGDIITVPNYDILDLVKSAAKRMGKYPSARIMTDETWDEVERYG